MKQDEKKTIAEKVLSMISRHNQYQEGIDEATAKALSERIEKSMGKPMVMLPESEQKSDIFGFRAFRPATAQELADESRPVSKVRGIKPIKPDTRPCLRFTPIVTRGSIQSADIIVLELIDGEIIETKQLEAKKPEHIFNALHRFAHTILGEAIQGRTATAWACTGMKDASGSRVFVQLVGQREDDPTALILGDIRAFSADELPDGLPENVDPVAYGLEQDRIAQARLHAQFMPGVRDESPEDRKRRQEKEFQDAKIAEGVEREMSKLKRDALGRVKVEV
jgi:hypothetical protein